MELSWTSEQQDRRARIIEHARRDINHKTRELDREENFDRSTWRTCAEMGLFGLPVAAEYGGQNADLLTTIYLLEGFGFGCNDNGLGISMGAHIWACEIPLQTFGTEEQKRKYLPLLCRGDWIGAHAVSEPGAGSDAFHLSASARRDGDEYILNGHKTYITNAPVADLIVVFATVDLDAGKQGLSAFLVEKNSPGLKTALSSKMGLRSAMMGEILLEDCRVPAANLLGKEGSGVAIFQQAMEWERGFILSGALGSMERVLQRTLAYARERRQFSKPIGKFQAVSHKIVDMKLRVETARALLYQAASKKQAGKSIHMESALAKYHIGESWVAVCTDALQIHAAHGYLTENEIERELRDALGGRILSGTSEIQKNIVASFLGL